MQFVSLLTILDNQLRVKHRQAAPKCHVLLRVQGLHGCVAPEKAKVVLQGGGHQLAQHVALQRCDTPAASSACQHRTEQRAWRSWCRTMSGTQSTIFLLLCLHQVLSLSAVQMHKGKQDFHTLAFVRIDCHI